MTPDAVLQRYVQLASSASVDVDALTRLISADPDLLGRWISLLRCRVNMHDLTAAMATIESDTLQNLAQAQIWTVTPQAGSARVTFEQWGATLRSACLAEGLAVEMGYGDPETIRLQILLAMAGVVVSTDPLMEELAEFRGTSPELLSDAHAALRIFAVVETQEMHGEVVASPLAKRLLDVDEDAYADSLTYSEAAAEGLVAGLGIDEGGAAEWNERLWLQQQIMAFSNVIAQQASPQDIQYVHTLITSEIFGRVPKTFTLDPADAELKLESERDFETVSISVSDSMSVVAKCLRARKPVQCFEGVDAAVVDRQLMHRLGVERLLAVPMIDEEMAIGVMLFGVDEDRTPNELEMMEAYTGSVAHRLAAERRHTKALESHLATYRQMHEKRLREIVHEANNPLSIVHNYLHILELRLQEDSKTTEQIHVIRDEISRTAGILKRVTDFPSADFDTPAAVVDVQRVSINDLVGRVAELVGADAENRGISLNTHFDMNRLEIDTDPGRVTQILTNLVRNAIEAMRDGGRVSITTQSGVYREGHAGVEIAVEDNGPGLTDDILDRLFQPKQTTKGDDHAGLGLHIVSQLVEELEGKIDVRTAAYKGTAFTIFLPLAVG